MPAIRRVGSSLLTAAVAAALIQAVLSFVVAPLQGRFGGEFEDFEVYFQGGRAVAGGQNPYAGFDAGPVTMSGFDYPPFAAWLLRPVMTLPHAAAATLWLWIALAALLVGALVTARVLLPAGWPRTRVALLVALTFAPATYNLWHGQMNTVIFLLLALALRDYVAGRQVRCGVLLGLAAGIKVAPALLLLLLIRRGWRSGALAGAATGAATLVVGALALGVDETRTWFTTVLPTLGRDNGWVYNQTWNGVFSRLTDHSVLTVATSSPLLRLATAGAGLATLLTAFRYTRGGERPTEERGAEFGAAVLAMLLVGSIAWFPHYVHLLIPLAAAIGLVTARGLGTHRLLAGATLGVAAVAGLAAPLAIAAAPMPRILALSHTSAWWPVLQLTSLPALTAAALLAALAFSLRHPPRQTITDSRRFGAPAGG